MSLTWEDARELVLAEHEKRGRGSLQIVVKIYNHFFRLVEACEFNNVYPREFY
jgi:hypothetical protein